MRDHICIFLAAVLAVLGIGLMIVAPDILGAVIGLLIVAWAIFTIICIVDERRG